MDKQQFDEDYYDATSFNYDEGYYNNGSANGQSDNVAGSNATNEVYEDYYNGEYDNGYNPYGDFNPYNNGDPYGQYGQYDQYRGVVDAPLDDKGRPIPNNFAMKMAISIIELFTATPFGIAGVICSVLQNDAYKLKNWESFKSKRTIANIMLGIGAGVTALWVLFFAAFIAYAVASSDDYYEEGNYTYDYDYGYDDDNDYDYGYNYNENIPYQKGMYSLAVNGKALTFPCSYEEFEKAWGEYEIDEDPSSYIINARKDEYITLLIGDNYAGSIVMYNVQDSAAPLKDCMVEGVDIRVQDYDGNKLVDIDYMGLGNEATANDFKEIFGEPSYDESEYTQWYTDEGWIEVETMEGSLKSIEITNYVSLENGEY